jgi:hypothetical protein
MAKSCGNGGYRFAKSTFTFESGIYKPEDGECYDDVRLNSAIGYITPKDVLAGRQQEIHAERDRKLEAARQQRQSHRQQAV